MRRLLLAIWITGLAACAGPGEKSGTGQSEAMRLVATITQSASDTPNRVGYLAVALQDAESMVQHATRAATLGSNSAALRNELLQIRQAMAADQAPVSGGASGFGLRRAVTAISERVGEAAAAVDASVNIRGEAVRIRRSARNVLERCDRIDGLLAQLEQVPDPKRAQRLFGDLQTLAEQVLTGVDANGDGLVTWRRGEGGLVTIRDHLHYLR